MAECFNIYLDESCHLEHDRIPVMTMGAVWCPADKAREVSLRIRDIRRQHELAEQFEIKWTKVSPAKFGFYQAVLDYFFDDDDLHFRGVVIPDKTVLDHAAFAQTHDDWYYKMCFRLLEQIIDPTQHYAVYLDIKDTRSERKRNGLERVLRNANYDGSGDIIRRVQQIRSHESVLLQLADLLIGAVSYANRRQDGSGAKSALVQRLRQRTGFSLARSTWLREPKFNLLCWQSRKVSQ